MLPNLLQLQHNNDKFHRHVIKKNGSDCWTWVGHTDDEGYGLFQFRHNDKKYKVRAHRASYMLAHGKLLDRNTILRHLCDTPSCVNPLHLTEGTHGNNVADRVKRRRSARGSQNGRAKLTEDNVRVIRQLLAEGKTKTSIADRFKVSRKMIQLISERKSWAHV